jgi:hypothetical protein
LVTTFVRMVFVVLAMVPLVVAMETMDALYRAVTIGARFMVAQ